MARQDSILNVGDSLPSFTREVTQDKIRQFEAAGQLLAGAERGGETPANIHTDAARAREMGLARPVASGQMSLAYLHELLARRFGPDFRQGGRLSVTFLKPVYPGDTLTAHGVVVGKEAADHRTRFSLEVWLENQRGERTSVGEAEVTVPSPLT